MKNFHSEQKGLRNYDEIIDVNQKLNKEVSASIQNIFPLVLVEIILIAVGSVSAISKHYNNLGVIWIMYMVIIPEVTKWKYSWYASKDFDRRRSQRTYRIK